VKSVLFGPFYFSISINMKVFFPVFCFLILLIIGCKSDTKVLESASEITVEIFLRYLGSDRHLKAEISFSEIDSLDKKRPFKMEEVLFQNRSLDGLKIQNRYSYQYAQNEPFGTFCNFQFTREGEATNDLKITYNPVDSFSIIDKSIKKSIGATLFYSPSPLQEQENLLLLISDTLNRTTTLNIRGPLDTEQIFLEPEQLKEMTSGPGKIFLVRRQKIGHSIGEIEVSGFMEYYSKQVNIMIEE